VAVLLVPAFVCLPILAIFVAWRTSYFGDPLPNTFNKKSGGALHLVGMKSTAALLIRTGLPILALLAGGLVVPKSRRQAATLLLVPGGWALAWLLISDEGNNYGRVQYPVLPALLVLSAPLYAETLLGLTATRAQTVGEVERLRAQNVRLTAQLAQTRTGLDIMGKAHVSWRCGPRARTPRPLEEVLTVPFDGLRETGVAVPQLVGWAKPLSYGKTLHRPASSDRSARL
jgi:hypothetical protein